MGFIEATKTCFRKYIVTSGRASRPEYWWFVLALIILSLVAGAIDAVIFGVGIDSSTGPLGIVVTLATLIPSITATVRRLHDTGKAWYYILVPVLAMAVGGVVMFALGSIGAILGVLIMLAGFAIYIWWLVKPSDPDTNAFGPNPFDPAGENVQEVFE